VFFISRFLDGNRFNHTASRKEGCTILPVFEVKKKTPDSNVDVAGAKENGHAEKTAV
jgi:hypothetical protein